jgi:hypothetical protein
MEEHHAREAERLLRDDTLNFVLDKLRKEAIEDLIAADAADQTSILRLQQRVEAIDGIRSTFTSMVRRVGKATSPAGTVA